MVMPRSSSFSNSAIESQPFGSSTQRMKAPDGRVTRVPRGKRFGDHAARGVDVRLEAPAQLAQRALVAAGFEQLGDASSTSSFWPPLETNFSVRTRSRQRPGSIQPDFRPGESVLENELHSMTLPVRS